MLTRQVLTITNLHIPGNKILEGEDLTAAMSTAAVIARSLLNIESLPHDVMMGDTIVKMGTMLGNHFKLSQIEAGLQYMRDQLAPSVLFAAEKIWDLNFLKLTSRSTDPENLKFEVVSIATTNVVLNIESFNEQGRCYTASTFIKRAVTKVYGGVYRTYENKMFDVINLAISEVSKELGVDSDEVTDEQIIKVLSKRGESQVSSPETIRAFRSEYYDSRRSLSLSQTTEAGTPLIDTVGTSEDFTQELVDKIDDESRLNADVASIFDRFTGTEMALLVAFRINKEQDIIPYFTDGENLASDPLFKAVVKGDAKYNKRLIDDNDNIKIGELLKTRNNLLQRVRSLISNATEMGPDRGIGLDKWLKGCSNHEADLFHKKGLELLPMIMRDLEDFEDYLQNLELDNYTPQPYDKSYVASRRSV